MAWATTKQGERLHYQEAGSGEPLVLVHGWAMSSQVWSPLMEDLARDRRVIALDLPGHGASPPAQHPLDLARLVQAVAELFEQLQLEAAVLAGWSLGAQVALASTRTLRKRLARLVLVSGTPRFTKGQGWDDGLPPSALQALALRHQRHPQRAVARFFEGMFAEGEIDPDRLAQLQPRPPDPAAAQQALQVLAQTDLRSSLSQVDLPVLLLHGDRDPICPPGASQQMARQLPHAQLERLPGLGHAPFLSQPQAFLQRLAPFLQEQR